VITWNLEKQIERNQSGCRDAKADRQLLNQLTELEQTAEKLNKLVDTPIMRHYLKAATATQGVKLSQRQKTPMKQRSATET